MMWNSNQIQNFTLANGAWKGKRGMGMEGGTNLVGQSDELPQKLISINQWVPNTRECTCDCHC